MNKMGFLLTSVAFWVLLSVFAKIFDVSLSQGEVGDILAQETPEEMNFFQGAISQVLSWAEEVPLIGNFIPLFRVLSFQYSSEIPWWLTLFLDIIAFGNIYVVFNMRS